MNLAPTLHWSSHPPRAPLRDAAATLTPPGPPPPSPLSMPLGPAPVPCPAWHLCVCRGAGAACQVPALAGGTEPCLALPGLTADLSLPLPARRASLGHGLFLDLRFLLGLSRPFHVSLLQERQENSGAGGTWSLSQAVAVAPWPVSTWGNGEAALGLTAAPQPPGLAHPGRGRRDGERRPGNHVRAVGLRAAQADFRC